MNSFQRTVRNLAFYAIVAVGGVLSLVSIIVVLELHNGVATPADVSADRLRASLTAVHQLTKQRHAAPLPRTDSATLFAAAGEPAAHTGTLLTLYKDQQEVVAQWKARTEAVLADLDAQMLAAVVRYEVEAGRPGIPEREKLFLDLSNWYHTQTQQANAYMDSGHNALAELSIALASTRGVQAPAEFSRRADSFGVKLSSAQRLLMHRPEFTTFSGVPRAVTNQDTRPWYRRIIPTSRPRPVTALTKWLRDERSLELASVIGMLGLGLLGAAASTVVRQKRAGTTDTTLPISDNLSSLLLSGMSAALATYMAVQGGLAIVSTEGAKPNPYLLLLTCFVAAVYWEEAWERVRKIIQARMDGREAEQQSQARDQQQPQGEQPVQPQGEQPVQPQGEQPVQPQGEQPVQPQGEQPVQPQGGQPVQPQGEQPVQPQGEQPVQPQGEQPVQPQGEPAEEHGTRLGGQEDGGKVPAITLFTDSGTGLDASGTEGIAPGAEASGTIPPVSEGAAPGAESSPGGDEASENDAPVSEGAMGTDVRGEGEASNTNAPAGEGEEGTNPPVREGEASESDRLVGDGATSAT